MQGMFTGVAGAAGLGTLSSQSSRGAEAQDGAVLEVLNPIASMEVERVVPAPRLSTLDNKRILLYWNRKLHADIAVDEIKTQLEKRLHGTEFKLLKGSPWAPEKGFYEQVLDWKPEAVIAATAD